MVITVPHTHASAIKTQMDDDRDWFAVNQSRRFRLRLPHHKELATFALTDGRGVTDAMARSIVLVANTPLACRFSYPVLLFGGASRVRACNTDSICALIWKLVQGNATAADQQALRVAFAAAKADQ